MTYDFSTRAGRDAIAEHLRQVAFEAGMICHPQAVDAQITWANESGSVYLSLPGSRKVRIGDHDAAYRCSISVSPSEMSVEQAEAWIRAEAAEDLEQQREEDAAFELMRKEMK